MLDDHILITFLISSIDTYSSSLLLKMNTNTLNLAFPSRGDLAVTRSRVIIRFLQHVFCVICHHKSDRGIAPLGWVPCSSASSQNPSV